MKSIRGFKLKRHIARFSKWFFHRTKPKTTSNHYHRLRRPNSDDDKSTSSSTVFIPFKPISNLITWGRRSLTCCKNTTKPSGWGYVPMDHQEPEKGGHLSVPKGYLAVYVGQKEEGGDFQRVLVPVPYCNHPLFSELLREAEEEYGYSHQGGITIPCGVSEFQQVQNRISAAGCGGRRMMWKRHHKGLNTRSKLQ